MAISDSWLTSHISKTLALDPMLGTSADKTKRDVVSQPPLQMRTATASTTLVVVFMPCSGRARAFTSGSSQEAVFRLTLLMARP